MPPKPFVDLSEFDLDHYEYGQEEIRARNKQRYEMELLNGIVAFRPDEEFVIGDYYAKQDDFWVRGHIPGRPIFPGVLMLELSGQLCSFYWRALLPDIDKFFGFGGIESARFRSTISPGDRLFVVAKPIQVKARRAIFEAQGLTEDRMVFETRVIGVPF